LLPMRPRAGIGTGALRAHSQIPEPAAIPSYQTCRLCTVLRSPREMADPPADVNSDDRKCDRRPSDELRNVAVSSILEVTSCFMYVESLDSLLQKIVKTVTETFGLATAHIGIRDPETGLFVVRAACGFEPEVEAKLRKVTYDMDRMVRDLKPEFKIGMNTYYVPAESWEPDDEDILFARHPERMDRARSGPNDWHEMDYIDLLLYDKDANLLGYLEIDEPHDHRVPDNDTIRAIEVFSDLAAIAIQNGQLYDQLDKDRKEIELLIDLIGHDVNNYSQAVSGFIELAMRRSDIPMPARKSLAKAHDQVMNLNKLVTNVKIYAKVESAGQKDIRPMDLVDTIKEAFVAAETHYPNREIELAIRDDGSVRASDMNELSRNLFLNLFSNAIKFDEHEKIVIDVGIESSTEGERDMWLVSIADRGPGIEDAAKCKVFDRFTQLKTTSIGTGLGLHIAKTLVDSYRGRIWVEDRVKGDRSQGSVFKILLPKSQL